jgi:hypothetical protein
MPPITQEAWQAAWAEIALHAEHPEMDEILRLAREPLDLNEPSLDERRHQLPLHAAAVPATARHPAAPTAPRLGFTVSYDERLVFDRTGALVAGGWDISGATKSGRHTSPRKARGRLAEYVLAL